MLHQLFTEGKSRMMSSLHNQASGWDVSFSIVRMRMLNRESQIQAPNAWNHQCFPQRTVLCSRTQDSMFPWRMVQTLQSHRINLSMQLLKSWILHAYWSQLERLHLQALISPQWLHPLWHRRGHKAHSVEASAWLKAMGWSMVAPSPKSPPPNDTPFTFNPIWASPGWKPYLPIRIRPEDCWVWLTPKMHEEQTQRSSGQIQANECLQISVEGLNYRPMLSQEWSANIIGIGRGFQSPSQLL